ncbi:MAG: hypothetical protein ACI9AA_003915 [Alteromonas sp.]
MGIALAQGTQAKHNAWLKGLSQSLLNTFNFLPFNLCHHESTKVDEIKSALPEHFRK